MRSTRTSIRPASPAFLNPGSDLARRGGCTCSMIKNFFGRGFGDPDRPLFEVAPDCPMHPTAGSGQEVRRG